MKISAALGCASALLSGSLCFAQSAAPVHTVATDAGSVFYTIDGPFAVTEGDIILGPAAEIEHVRAAQQSGVKVLFPRSLVLITTGSRLWPDSTMPYTIDADVPNQQAILDGIAHWNTRTAFKIIPRTNENNYVRFQHINLDVACNSNIGMIGGAQIIGITNNCPTGSVIHELGHAWGLFHEQQRNDRNGNLTVLYQNIDKRFVSNFPQSTSASDSGYYDFDSIMHYDARGFSRNSLDALESVPPGIPLGQRSGLSSGDIDGVSRLYKMAIARTTVTTAPAGLQIRVDGEIAVSPNTYDWAPGTQHTVTAQAVQGSDPRYTFALWSDGGQLTHTVTASATVTALSANFVRERSIGAGVSSGKGSVAVYPVPTGGFLRERVPFVATATAAEGFQFVRWIGSTWLSYNGQSFSANPVQVEMENGANNYLAVFTSGPVATITSMPAGAAVLVDGVSYLTPINFAWTPGSTHTLGANATELFGNSTRRMQFRNWDDGSTGVRTITAEPTSRVYSGTFNQQFLLSTAASGPGTLAGSPAAADGFYDAGSTVAVTAAAAAGQTLRYWLGDAAGSSTTANIVMDEQRSVTAFFGTALTMRVLNAGSFQANPNPLLGTTVVAPGEMVAIFCSCPGPATGLFGGVDANGKFPFTLGGVSVLFDGFAAPIVYASNSQINVVVPYGITGQTATTVKIAAGLASISASVGVADVSPSLFTYNGSGVGQLAALNENGTVNSAANPAVPGSIVVLYATGAGAWTTALPDGKVLVSELGIPKASVWVRFGKLPGEILYAGSAPYLINGVTQVNVRIPAELSERGDVPVQLITGVGTSQTGVSIAIDRR